MDKITGSPHELGPRTRLRRVEGIAWRMIEGEAVLVNVRSDEVMHLNPAASFLWSSLDGQLSLEDIASSITAEYDVELDTALSDALDFAGSLIEQGAVEIVELE
ncbi:MAG: PqqD family protein [Actinobacteria bacterium]|nr:PqqD family protein [Actinomycetota bacterium]